MMAPRKNIVLCGFMGSGKSTVGKLLSRRLNMEFIDMDDYIEQQQGMEIREIFASMGEAAFRRMETEAAEKLSATGGHVIAAGGGTLLSSKMFRSGAKGGNCGQNRVFSFSAKSLSLISLNGRRWRMPKMMMASLRRRG